MSFDPQDPSLKAIFAQLEPILMEHEEVEQIAVSKAPSVSIGAAACVALTNKRVIFMRPKAMGLSTSFEDHFWRNVKAAHLNEGIIGSKFSVTLLDGQELTMDYLNKSQSRGLYKFAQRMEEEMEEFRRRQEMEMRQASAGNTTLVSTPTPTPSPPVDELGQKLAQLKQLYERQLITAEEYESKKRALLDQL